jgi:hypothetical protein
MKNLKTIFAILFISLLALSCSNEDNETPAQNQTPASDYFFKAKIDGVQYTASAIQVLSSSSTERITITSVLSDNRNFELQISRPTGLGTYNYPTPVAADYLLRMTYGDASSATALWKTGTCSLTTGTLTITALSATEISGNFLFTGKRTSFCSDAGKIITEGSFKSKIVQ